MTDQIANQIIDLYLSGDWIGAREALRNAPDGVEGFPYVSILFADRNPPGVAAEVRFAEHVAGPLLSFREEALAKGA